MYRAGVAGRSYRLVRAGEEENLETWRNRRMYGYCLRTRRKRQWAMRPAEHAEKTKRLRVERPTHAVTATGDRARQVYCGGNMRSRRSACGAQNERPGYIECKKEARSGKE